MPTSTLCFAEPVLFRASIEWACGEDVLSTRAVLVGLAVMVDHAVALFNIKALAFWRAYRQDNV
jgi:hypothetical protein